MENCGDIYRCLVFGSIAVMKGGARWRHTHSFNLALRLNVAKAAEISVISYHVMSQIPVRDDVT